jgi:hypothetical protein
MTRHRLLLVLVLMLALLAAPAGRSLASNRYRTLSTVTVAPGLTYKAIVDSKGPNHIYELIVDIHQALTMDVALAGNQLGTMEKTTSMASRHGAIAAINGDFGNLPGYPMDRYQEDGDFKISSVNLGTDDFAVSQDEASVNIGPPSLSMSFLEVDTAKTWRIDRWNYGAPTSGQIAAYTPAGGTYSNAQPPGSKCYAQLTASSGLMWTGSQMGLARNYSVNQRVCQTTALTVPSQGAVLAAVPGTTQANELTSLTVGETVRLSESFGWRDAMDVIGGYPMLMQGGQVVATNCSQSICDVHPRTAVGIRGDGKLLMVVVDGRQPGYSVGMTLVELASLFKWLGAVTAMNMDGGGSSTMVVNGQIKNRPSDSTGERAVSSALLVLPGADAGEPTPSALSSTSSAAVGQTGATATTNGPLTRRSGLAAQLDPASTGGLLDALASGAFGPPQSLPPDLLEVLELFRNSLQP